MIKLYNRKLEKLNLKIINNNYCLDDSPEYTRKRSLFLTDNIIKDFI